MIGLQVWTLAIGSRYDLLTEVDAVRQCAAIRGWDRYDLFGFSAGATVALAAALADPRAVRTLALLEPASIGDDDWSEQETRWRRDLDRIRRLPNQQRQPAFRHLMMGADEQLPSGLPKPPRWDQRTDTLEDVLAAVGFSSDDLANVVCPTLVITGALSSSRFFHVAERLVDVLPDAESVILPGCSHLAPPHRAAPDRLMHELSRLWDRPRANDA